MTPDRLNGLVEKPVTDGPSFYSENRDSALRRQLEAVNAAQGNILVRIETGLRTGDYKTLFGAIVLDQHRLGIGSLSIPTDYEPSRESPFSQFMHIFAQENGFVLSGQNDPDRLESLGLTFNESVDDITPSNSASGTSSKLSLRRDSHYSAENWRNPHKGFFTRLENDELIKSAEGLIKHMSEVLGWEITPLSPEEIEELHTQI